MKYTYTRLSTDLGSALSGSPVIVSLDGVIQEQSILVEVIAWLLLCHSDGLGERLSGGLQDHKYES